MANCERCYEPDAGDFTYPVNPRTGQRERLCAHCAEAQEHDIKRERESDDETE